MKKLFAIVLGIAVLMIGVTTVLAATNAKTPAEVYADMKEITSEEAYEERGTDKTFGQLAKEEGNLDEFKDAMLENKKAIVKQRVEEGTITQEQADTYLKAMEERMEDCDGTGNGERLGQKYGMGFGRSNAGNGAGKGLGNGAGRGMGNGTGRGMGRGCTVDQQAE